VASAKFFARILGLPFEESTVNYFAPVRVNEAPTLDFADSEQGTDAIDRDRIASHHYAFKASEGEFEAIFARLQAEGITYGSGPYSQEDMQINHRGGGRGVYFCDPNGHLLELLTVE
jgi:catechol 2,3-dioxygenase-like lactoylglutathione lyase family enzyme